MNTTIETHMPISTPITVSIGIPAYTEEQNIVKLLTSLLAQKKESFLLKEIIVVVDGSGDSTGALVKSLNSPLIRIVEHTNRLGQQTSQNEILGLYTGDILVFMEADTLPYNTDTINNLIKPFAEHAVENIGMVVGYPEVLPAKLFFEKVIYHGFQIKRNAFYAWNRGVNVYTCNGQVMKALSQPFTKKLQYPVNVPEDAYTYLCAKHYGFGVLVSHDAKVFMKCVSTLGDRIKQCMKFQSGKRALLNYFSPEVITDEYRIPISLVCHSIFMYLLHRPFWTVLAVFEMVFNKLYTLKTAEYSYAHSIYYSSKNLTVEQ